MSSCLVGHVFHDLSSCLCVLGWDPESFKHHAATSSQILCAREFSHIVSFNLYSFSLYTTLPPSLANKMSYSIPGNDRIGIVSMISEIKPD